MRLCFLLQRRWKNESTYEGIIRSEGETIKKAIQFTGVDTMKIGKQFTQDPTLKKLPALLKILALVFFRKNNPTPNHIAGMII